MTLQDSTWAWEQAIPSREKLLLLAMAEMLGDASEWCEWNEARTARAAKLTGLTELEVAYGLANLLNVNRVEVRTAFGGEKQLRFNYGEPEAVFTPRRADPGYVYALWAGDHFKIGRSKHPNKRIEQIQTASPFEVQQFARIDVQDMGELERHLHEKFADRRVKGEWFRFGQDEVDLITAEFRAAGKIDAAWRPPR